MNRKPGLEIHQWEYEGYMPLVFSHDWQVALLNWEPIFDLDNAGEIERHNQTDEVFILVNGKAVLFTVTPEGDINVEEMLPNVLYNVLQGCWHNLISTRDATWIIVENRNTHLTDGEFRRLTEDEMACLRGQLPEWARRKE